MAAQNVERIYIKNKPIIVRDAARKNRFTKSVSFHTTELNIKARHHR